MDVKPILFNTEMVRAILEGRKTVTRRVVKPQPEGRPVPMTKDSCWPGCFAIQGTEKVVRPPYQPGDILWVRETWRIQSAHRFEADAKIEYKAGGPMGKVKFKCRSDYDCFIWNQPVGEGKWKPSIHMPREAARIFLRVTGVRVERLQDNGNCTEVGGFCTAVPAAHCPLIPRLMEENGHLKNLLKAAETRAEKAEKERDAAVKDLHIAEDCDTCKTTTCVPRGGNGKYRFEWRGQKEE